MRYANENSVDLERKKGDKSPRVKYYIIPEGDKTEIKYFLGVKNYSTELNIKPIIDIIPIENDDSEFGQSHPKHKIQNFNDDINDGKFILDEMDRVWFIVDRDKGNFKDKQLDDFIEACNENGYYVGLSNPAFEVFLLMHDDRILGYNREDMLNNEKVSTTKRFLELKLSAVFGCNKTNLNFEVFLPNIQKAIENEKAFCEDINGLKTELGSNVGKLLEEMIEKQDTEDK